MTRRRRWTIASLIGLIGVCALVFATLRKPTILGVQTAATVALTALLIAALGACVGRDRAAFLGFVLFGGVYAMLTLGPGASYLVRPQLLSTRGLDLLFGLITEKDVRYESFVMDTAIMEGHQASLLFRDEYYQFQVIGHWWATVAHGTFGAAVGAYLAKWRRRPGG